MNHPRVFGIGTANPTVRLTQEQTFHAVPDAASASFSKLIDLNMLLMNGERERTKAEFSVLLNAAGFELTRIIRNMAPQSTIEATTTS